MWGTINDDDAGIVSKSAEGLANDDSNCHRLRGSRPHGFGKKDGDMLPQTRDLASRAPPFVIEAAGQRYTQAMQFLHLGGVAHEDADLMVEIKRRVRPMRGCYKRFGPELLRCDDRPAQPERPPAEGRGD